MQISISIIFACLLVFIGLFIDNQIEARPLKKHLDDGVRRNVLFKHLSLRKTRSDLNELEPSDDQYKNDQQEEADPDSFIDESWESEFNSDSYKAQTNTASESDSGSDDDDNAVETNTASESESDSDEDDSAVETNTASESESDSDEDDSAVETNTASESESDSDDDDTAVKTKAAVESDSNESESQESDDESYDYSNETMAIDSNESESNESQSQESDSSSSEELGEVNSQNDNNELPNLNNKFKAFLSQDTNNGQLFVSEEFDGPYWNGEQDDEDSGNSYEKKK
jgi:clumping factor A